MRWSVLLGATAFGRVGKLWLCCSWALRLGILDASLPACGSLCGVVFQIAQLMQCLHIHNSQSHRGDRSQP